MTSRSAWAPKPKVARRRSRLSRGKALQMPARPRLARKRYTQKRRCCEQRLYPCPFPVTSAGAVTTPPLERGCRVYSFSPHRGEKVGMRGESIAAHRVTPLTLFPSAPCSGGEGSRFRTHSAKRAAHTPCIRPTCGEWAALAVSPHIRLSRPTGVVFQGARVPPAVPCCCFLPLLPRGMSRQSPGGGAVPEPRSLSPDPFLYSHSIVLGGFDEMS